MKVKSLIIGILSGAFIIGGLVLFLAYNAFLAGVFLVSIGLIAAAFAVVFSKDPDDVKNGEAPHPQKPTFSRNNKAATDLGLSSRDISILELMEEGNSNQEIANKTNIPVNAVNVSVNAIFKKLDVTRRSKAIKKARELKLIP